MFYVIVKNVQIIKQKLSDNISAVIRIIKIKIKIHSTEICKYYVRCLYNIYIYITRNNYYIYGNHFKLRSVIYRYRFIGFFGILLFNRVNRIRARVRTINRVRARRYAARPCTSFFTIPSGYTHIQYIYIYIICYQRVYTWL